MRTKGVNQRDEEAQLTRGKTGRLRLMQKRDEEAELAEGKEAWRLGLCRFVFIK